MDARKLESWLATFLEVAKFKDYSPNCMIVEGGRDLQKGVSGVSLNLELIQAAVERDASFILVHHPHGFWNSDPRLPRGTLAKKLKLLLENGISVYGYHLPLDGHPVVGNNAQIASALGLFDREGFSKAGEGFVGCQGLLEQPVPVDEFMAKISEAVGEPNFVFRGGPETVQRIAICSGGAANGVLERLDHPGVDLYLTGEPKEQTRQLALEEGFHFVACGHHATERFGVKALSRKLEEKFGLEIEFVDVPNPV